MNTIEKFFLMYILISTHVFAQTRRLPTDVSLTPGKEVIDNMIAEERARQQADENDPSYTDIAEFRFDNVKMAQLLEQSFDSLIDLEKIDTESMKFSRTGLGMGIGAFIALIASWNPVLDGRSVRKFKMSFDSSRQDFERAPVYSGSCGVSVVKRPNRRNNNKGKDEIVAFNPKELCHNFRIVWNKNREKKYI